MKRIYVLFSVFISILLGACIDIADLSDEDKARIAAHKPQCRKETMVKVEDDEGVFWVPGCTQFDMPQVPPTIYQSDETYLSDDEKEDAAAVEPQEEATPEPRYRRRMIKKIEINIPEEERDIDWDEIEGNLPDVAANKYTNEVILINRDTNTLAYCRGTNTEVERCVERLEKSCYVQFRDIPMLPAKHDELKQGTYPTRRWRNGDVVPRW